MIEVGRLVIKTAGRDSGKKGLVIDIIDDNYAMVDGQVRRKKCNINHLEPLETLVTIGKNASHEEVVEELKKIGIAVKAKAAKEKQKAAAKPTKGKKETVKTAKPKAVKKAK